MTMPALESTLFGGWARARTLPPIEIGAPKAPAVTIAFSAFNPVEEVWAGKVTLIKIFARDGAVATARGDMSMGFGEMMREHLRKTALVRFCESWPGTKISRDVWMRAIAGRGLKISASFAGMMGTLNCAHAARKTAEGWAITSAGSIYPSVPRMVERGAAAIRQRARRIALEREH